MKNNILERFNDITEYWSPKILAEINDSYLKIAKMKGEFVWHNHSDEDEYFQVIKGEMIIKFEDKEVLLRKDDFFVVPKKVEHCPVAKEECWVMIFEKRDTKHTGDKVTELTKSVDEQK